MELVPESGLMTLMEGRQKETKSFLSSIPEALYDHRYAPDKWTVREVLGHVCDIERAFGYRLLCAARGDEQELKRVDGNLYIQNGEFARLGLMEWANEFQLVRKSNLIFLQHMPEPAWDRVALMAGAKVTVRALGYLLVGHERHHLRILRENYLKTA
jgi:hypothetical protein